MVKREIEVIVPTNIQAMMSGAILAQVFGQGSPRVVRLTYSDGRTEETYLSVQEIAEGKDNWFSLVSSVQKSRS